MRLPVRSWFRIPHCRSGVAEKNMAEPSPTPDPPAGWFDPPAALELRGADVHVWRLKIQTAPPEAWSLLSLEERAAAERFKFERDRQRFISCRAQLRRILSRYVGQPPEALAIARGEFGKPYLSARSKPSSIRFNMSHSAGVALVAVANDREVGVDVESLDTDLDPQDLAARFFTPGEQSFVRQHPEAEQNAAFLACWTRKEAWMKAVGVGFREPLERFDVSAALGGGFSTLKRTAGDGLDWTVLPLTGVPGAIAALAVEGTEIRLHFWQIPFLDTRIARSYFRIFRFRA